MTAAALSTEGTRAPARRDDRARRGGRDARARHARGARRRRPRRRHRHPVVRRRTRPSIATPSSASRRSPSRSPRWRRCHWSRRACCASTSPSTTCCPSSPTAGCCARSTPSSTTRCPPTDRSRSRTCSASGSGFGSVMAPPGSYPIQRAEAELGLQSIGGPPWPPGRARRRRVDRRRSARCRCMYQPGEQWLYNTSAPGARRAAGAGGGHGPRDGACASASSSRSAWPTPASPCRPISCSRLTTVYRPIRETGELVRARDPRRQLVEHAAVVPRRQRLAGLDHRRLLVVRLDAARRRQPARPARPLTANRWR